MGNRLIQASSAKELSGSTLPFAVCLRFVIRIMVYIVGSIILLLLLLLLLVFELEFDIIKIVVNKDIWNASTLIKTLVKLIAFFLLFLRILGLLVQVVGVGLVITLDVSHSIVIVHLNNIDVEHRPLQAIPPLAL